VFNAFVVARVMPFIRVARRSTCAHQEAHADFSLLCNAISFCIHDIQGFVPLADGPDPDDGQRLAKGWEKLETDDGLPYYYNESTDETSWEPPMA
jgi:hypothetical protein